MPNSRATTMSTSAPMPPPIIMPPPPRRSSTFVLRRPCCHLIKRPSSSVSRRANRARFSPFYACFGPEKLESGPGSLLPYGHPETADRIDGSRTRGSALGVENRRDHRNSDIGGHYLGHVAVEVRGLRACAN